MTSSSTSSEDVGDRANALGSAVSSHTPGPWAYRQSHSDTCDLEVLDSDGNVVAGEYGVREQANARLIAAAPDLLAVCRKILNHPLIRLTGDVEPELIAAISKANAERERSSSPSTGL
jgi:hypothetical protein